MAEVQLQSFHAGRLEALLEHDTPTKELYGELNYAYAFFNERLFNATLPDCLISLARDRRVYGYMLLNRAARADGRAMTHEIAINPLLIPKRPVKDTLATLCREMVNVWQVRFGRPGRRGYKNLEWAWKMRSVGLIPKDLGKSGHEVGDTVAHTIEQLGPFDIAAQELLSTGFQLSWIDTEGLPRPRVSESVERFGAPLLGGTSANSESRSDATRDGQGTSLPSCYALDIIERARIAESVPSEFIPAATLLGRSDNSARRRLLMYACPGCHQRAWSKSEEFAAKCLPCDRAFVRA